MELSEVGSNERKRKKTCKKKDKKFSPFYGPPYKILATARFSSYGFVLRILLAEFGYGVQHLFLTNFIF